MARDLAGALGPALAAGPVPADAAAIIDYAGGKRALTEQLAGMSGPARRRDYRTDEAFQTARRKWAAAQRRVERWADGSRRPRLEPAEKGKLRKAANRRRRDEMARRGLRARMFVTTRIATPGKPADVRTRWIPALGTPAAYLDGDTVAEILDQLAEEGVEAAAEDFQQAFLEEWGIDEDIEMELEEILEFKVWLEGEPEPW